MHVDFPALTFLPAAEIARADRNHILATGSFLPRGVQGNIDISASDLYSPKGGRMLGVLVCSSPQGETKVLRAFSSKLGDSWIAPGYVPPVHNIEEYQDILTYAPVPTGGKQDRETGRALLADIHSLYQFTTHDGQQLPLSQIWADSGEHRGIPAGTGDCCGPKLFQHAASMNLTPMSFAEIFVGNATTGRRDGWLYPPCVDRCAPIMPCLHPAFPNWGLTVTYYDEEIVVIVKEASMLSIPGRGPDKQDSVASRIREMFPGSIPQPSVHRLDMDTSGLMVFARTDVAHRNLSIQFQNREVKKRYTAQLDGELIAEEGEIRLSFRLDPADRPRQIYDPIQGKEGITHWKRDGVTSGRNGRKFTRVRFYPKTGRTHQLRLHASHPEGLGLPITGDRLYGRKTGKRMMLHADYLSFRHPSNGKQLSFYDPAPF